MVVSWLAVIRASRSCEYTIASTLLSCRGISSPTLYPAGATLSRRGVGPKVGGGESWGKPRPCYCALRTCLVTGQKSAVMDS